MKSTAFEILELPSRPSLDLELLESNLRHLSAHYHPDQKTGNIDFFEQLQKAAATVRRPSSRLRLLADTELLSKRASADEVPEASSAEQRSVVLKLPDTASIGATPPFAAEVEFRKKSTQEKFPFPSAAADLFQTIASALEKSKMLLASHHAASGALSKALLMPPLLAAHAELLTAQQLLQAWEQTLHDKLQSLDACWPNVDKTELLSLAHSFTFAERWTDQVRERLLAFELLF